MYMHTLCSRKSLAYWASGSYLGLDFIVEELLLEMMQGIVCTVTVQVHGVQDVPGGGHVRVM